MESLSNFILNNNRDLFPNYKRFSKISTNFTNYYSSSTSTYMTMLDLFLSGDTAFEKCDYLENIFEEGVKTKESLFDLLKQTGYACKSFFYGFENIDTVLSLNKLIFSDCDLWEGNNKKDLLQNISDSLKTNLNRNFAFFIDDNSSHISFKSTAEKSFLNITDWFKNRYSSIDNTLGYILDCIELLGLKDNTVLLVYGDHGEEFWTHGLHGGYSHAIEPFFDVSNCPLGVLDDSKQEIVCSKLISTLDLKNFILSKIEFESQPFVFSRKYAFSRNLFLNQFKRSNIFNKSYFVTDSEYTLIKDKFGYSLFFNRIDPTNNFNILDLFKYKKGRLFYNKTFDYLPSSHLKSFISSKSIAEFSAKFNELKLALDDYIISLGTKKTLFKNKLKNNTLLKISLFFLIKSKLHFAKKIFKIFF